MQARPFLTSQLVHQVTQRPIMQVLPVSKARRQLVIVDVRLVLMESVSVLIANVLIVMEVIKANSNNIISLV